MNRDENGRVKGKQWGAQTRRNVFLPNAKLLNDKMSTWLVLDVIKRKSVMTCQAHLL
jgi:hypothetical protein